MGDETTTRMSQQMQQFLESIGPSKGQPAGENCFVEQWREWLDSERWERFAPEVFEKILQARREYDSKLFFIVIFGPLKAGKSTLINCLTRHEELSPTRFGEECTLRPSIIVQAPHGAPEEILTYRSKDTAAGMDSRRFNMLIDSLRGIREGGVPKVKAESAPLCESNLKKCLTGSTGREPLITILRVGGEGLFGGDDVALIDMPGLDGSQANMDSPVYKWVIERADFLIFVQSSLSAINEPTARLLKKFHEGKARVPETWVLINEIDAKPWRPQSIRRADLEDQQRHADSQLQAQLRRINGDIAFEYAQVNLGRASDYYFKSAAWQEEGWDAQRRKKELLEGSQLPEFESKLRGHINRNRGDMVYDNATGSLKDAFRSAQDYLRGQYAACDEMRGAFEALECGPMGEIKRRLREYRPREEAREAIWDAVSGEAERFIKELSGEGRAMLAALHTGAMPCTKEQLAQKLDEFYSAFKALSQELFEKRHARIDSILREGIEGEEKALCASLKPPLEALNEGMQKLSGEPFETYSDPESCLLKRKVPDYRREIPGPDMPDEYRWSRVSKKPGGGLIKAAMTLNPGVLAFGAEDWNWNLEKYAEHLAPEQGGGCMDKLKKKWMQKFGQWLDVRLNARCDDVQDCLQAAYERDFESRRKNADSTARRDQEWVDSLCKNIAQLQSELDSLGMRAST